MVARYEELGYLLGAGSPSGSDSDVSSSGVVQVRPRCSVGAWLADRSEQRCLLSLPPVVCVLVVLMSLRQGHAYSVLQVREVNGNQLMQVWFGVQLRRAVCA